MADLLNLHQQSLRVLISLIFIFISYCCVFFFAGLSCHFLAPASFKPPFEDQRSYNCGGIPSLLLICSAADLALGVRLNLFVCVTQSTECFLLELLFFNFSFLFITCLNSGRVVIMIIWV